MDIDLILLSINNLGPGAAKALTASLNWVARNYSQLLDVVRCTVPCVILFCLLVCLRDSTNTETE